MKIKILKFLKEKWWEILVYILVVGFGFSLFIGSIYDKWDRLINEFGILFDMLFANLFLFFLIWISLMYFIYN
ncbi:hypothetical protein [Spiroplasma citri]|uniref:Plectrovirus spv1-c74 orf 15 transmembrane protein n=1 Tax=Spiroplasma citri TaxID=2133 RepID=Q14NN7_SPICI|nr:hypothetical protein [Spiroplasma citri]APE75126.1 plectrovirus-related protein [Spiroplasma citri]QED25027.1 hypothetical protein FRX96_06425 [Spiroplasma citri]QIA67382.1 hypothetical protein GMI18_06885 [Spiroplasma citri]QIA69232.1 hypothetical protein GL298_06830 [Spiroplasma citri]QIA71099.1 hypothetical protein GL981_06885 [Spiroplasma citri]